MNNLLYESIDGNKLREYLNYELNSLRTSNISNNYKNILTTEPLKFPKISNNIYKSRFLNCNHEVEFNCLSCLKGDLNSFYNEEQLIQDRLFNDLKKTINICDLTGFTSKEYYNDSIDIQKLVGFYEKYFSDFFNKQFNKYSNIISQLKYYLNNKVNEIAKISTQLINYTINYNNNEFKSILLKYINDSQKNLYIEVDFNNFVKELKAKNVSFLKLNSIFQDFNLFVKQFDTNIELKYDFYNKIANNTNNKLNISDYIDIIKTTCNNILSYKDKPFNNSNNLNIDITNNNNKLLKSKYISNNPNAKELFTEELSKYKHNFEYNSNYNIIFDEIIHKTRHNPNYVISYFELIDSGRMVVSASRDLSLKVTNLYSLTEKINFNLLHNSDINKIILLGNGLIATCSNDCVIKVIDIISNKIIFEINKHTDWVNDIILLENNYIVSCGDDGYVKFFEIHNYNNVKTIRSPDKKPIKTLLKIKGTNYIIFSTRVIYIYNYAKDIVEKSLDLHKGFITILKVDYKRNLLVSVSEDQFLILWNISNFEVIGKYTFSVDIKCLSFYKGYYVFSTSDNYLKLWDPDLKIIIMKRLLNIFTLCIQTDDNSGIFYSQYNEIIQLKNSNIK